MTQNTTIGNADDGAAHVLCGAPRLANVTNLTVISFSFLEGARKAIINAPNVTEEVREVADGYCIASEHMTVVRVHALLDRDDQVISYQSVHRCLKRPEVVAVSFVASMGPSIGSFMGA
jgi:hypothetical protein